MDMAEETRYAHPLTIDAVMFLDALQNSIVKTSCIDNNLVQLLDNVVSSIESFVSNASNFIVETDCTKLVGQHEMSALVRSYHCSKCKQFLGTTSIEALKHILENCEPKLPPTLRESEEPTKSKENKEPVKRKENKESGKTKGKPSEMKESKMPKKLRWFLSQDLTDFFDKSHKVSETLKYVPDHDLVTNELSALINPLFPEDSNVTLYKFGSRINGTGSSESDLDIFVDIGKCFNIFEDKASSKTLHKFKKVCEELKQKKQVWRHIQSIDKARVPIIRVTHANSHIELDIGFSNSLGYCNTILMEYLFELQPIARHMCIFLKKWLQRSKLPKYSSYILNLMVIYYLQLNEYLPSIEALQTDMETCVRVGPWIGNYNKKTRVDLKIPLVDSSAPNCLKFLRLFFDFYSIFEYETYAVSPFLGKLVLSKNIELEMPERYHIHVNSCGSDAQLEVNNVLMTVQDPLQLNHNITQNIPKSFIKPFNDYFKQTAELLSTLKFDSPKND